MAEEVKQQEAKAEKNSETPKTEEKKTEGAKSAPKKRSSKRKTVVEGAIHIKASVNNTIVTMTDAKGDTLAWATSGASGFKGTRKSTPYAAQIATENAVEKVKNFGFERAHVFIKGVGVGRDQALRAISARHRILSITDLASVPLAAAGPQSLKSNPRTAP